MTEIEAGECPVCHTRDEDDSGPHTGNCYIALRDRVEKLVSEAVAIPAYRQPGTVSEWFLRRLREVLEGKP